MSRPVVAAEDLGKTYRVYGTPWDRVLEAILRRPRHRNFEAVGGVSFQLPRGEGLGIVGQNGAGKSTLLKMLAGIVAPTAGRMEVRGQVGSILELGSGFHPEFTGRQNIRLNAAMLGLGPAEVEERTPAIIEFSELGEFIDRPVKTYSTGMAMRLGFSIATQIEPDVLIIDEALSVGDGYFQKKCMDHLQGFLGDGGTLLFCSHALYYVSVFCQRALWLRNGRVEALGPADDVIREYENMLVEKSRSERSVRPQGAERPEGLGPARIAAVEVGGGRESLDGGRIVACGEPLSVRVEWTAEDPGAAFHVAIGIDRPDGLNILTFATHFDGREALRGKRRHDLLLRVPNQPLNKGEYAVTVLLFDEAGLHIYDQKIVPGAVHVEQRAFAAGLIRAEHRWELCEPESDTAPRPGETVSGAGGL